MTVADALVLASVACVALALVATAVVGSMLRRALRRWARHAERRVVDAALAWAAYVLFGRWRRARGRRVPVRPPLEGDDFYRACPLSAWEGGLWACRWCNGLLPRGKPRFCGPQCRHPAEENHVWGPAKDATLRRGHYLCRACGQGAGPDHSLEVNHITPILGRHRIPGCHHHATGLEVLGESCHRVETNGQRARGEFGRARRWAS